MKSMKSRPLVFAGVSPHLGGNKIKAEELWCCWWSQCCFANQGQLGASLCGKRMTRRRNQNHYYHHVYPHANHAANSVTTQKQTWTFSTKISVRFAHFNMMTQVAEIVVLGNFFLGEGGGWGKGFNWVTFGGGGGSIPSSYLANPGSNHSRHILITRYARASHLHSSPISWLKISPAKE